ncbi:ATP-binding protein [Chitinibacter sp. SCUT-21]|uniref:ATP-binding protein n=1 Tax=Chitinibacter sp. SCUT-21 TaxID=2970891 RepID=UPI0035A5AEA1
MDSALRRIDRIARDHPLIAFRLVERYAEQAHQAHRIDLELDALYVRYLIHERRGENDLIADDINQALQEAMRRGLTAQGARLLQARGRIAQVHGRYQQAIEAWMQALELAKLNHDYVTAVEARIGLSQSNIELKNPSEALRYLLAAQDDVQQSGDEYLMAKYAINCGVSSLHRNALEESLAHFNEGLLHSQLGHVREYVAESYWHIGHVEMELAQYAAAELHLNQAIKMAQQFSYLWLESVTLDSLSLLFTKLGQHRQRRECLQAAYALAEKTRSLARQRDYAAALVDAFEAEGDLSTALAWVKTERTLSEEHFKRSLIPVHRSMKALDLTEHDVQEKLLMLSLHEQTDVELHHALAALLAEARSLLGAEWLGLWFLDPYRDLAELAAESPSPTQGQHIINADSYPWIYRLIGDLVTPLPISQLALHEAAAEFYALLGEHVCSLMIVPIRQSHQMGLLMLSHRSDEGQHTWSRDDVFRANLLQQIIERQLANQARAQLQSELERNERVGALGTLVAAVAHELNTPIGVCITLNSVIDADLQQLKHKFDTGQLSKTALAQYLQTTHDAHQTLTRNLNRVVGLIERFRAIQNLQFDSHWQTMSLSQFLQGLVKELAPPLEQRGISIELSGDDAIETPIPMMALAQIISQLFDNAERHAFVGQAHGHVSLQWSRKEQQIQLIYQDNGVGIAEHLREKIFDPFFTSQFGQGQNGLGLTRVYQLVTINMNGSIRVKSTPDQGLRIILRWPEPK